MKYCLDQDLLKKLRWEGVASKSINTRKGDQKTLRRTMAGGSDHLGTSIQKTLGNVIEYIPRLSFSMVRMLTSAFILAGEVVRLANFHW